MRRLVIYPNDERRAFDFADDVKRIISVCKDYDCWIDFATARQAWEDWSQEYDANWLTLPEDDDVLFVRILEMVDTDDGYEFVIWLKYLSKRVVDFVVSWLGRFTRILREPGIARS